MRNPKRRCVICHVWYRPNPRTRLDQLVCRREGCRKKRKAEYDRAWRRKNPGYGAWRKQKLRIWAKAYPNYWRHYRKTHPDYVERERRRMRSERLERKSVAKQVLMRQIAVDKLRSIQAIAPKSVAKQVAIHLRVNGIVDYLFWKEGVAKPRDMDAALSLEIKSQAWMRKPGLKSRS